jgi:spore coat polysaccharide biosynthesis protein SpsF
MKTAILITARLKSERLPKKVLLPIHGKPMISHMIDRLKTSRRADGIILCTSPLPEDNPLVDIARKEGIAYFRGHPDDVLRRLTDAARWFEVDLVINCTADNPFVDAVYLDRLADFHLHKQNDYSFTEGLPWGTFGWTLSRPAMEKACLIKDEIDTEVWGGYFTETGLFRWGILRADPADYWPDLRLTVDTPEDFELVTGIFNELYQPGEVFSLQQILDLCRRHPDLTAINAHIKQKRPKPIRVREEATDEPTAAHSTEQRMI